MQCFHCQDRSRYDFQINLNLTDNGLIIFRYKFIYLPKYNHFYSTILYNMIGSYGKSYIQLIVVLYKWVIPETFTHPTGKKLEDPPPPPLSIIVDLLLWEVDPPHQTAEISSMRGVCVWIRNDPIKDSLLIHTCPAAPVSPVFSLMYRAISSLRPGKYMLQN